MATTHPESAASLDGHSLVLYASIKLSDEVLTSNRDRFDNAVEAEMRALMYDVNEVFRRDILAWAEATRAAVMHDGA